MSVATPIPAVVIPNSPSFGSSGWTCRYLCVRGLLTLTNAFYERPRQISRISVFSWKILHYPVGFFLLTTKSMASSPGEGGILTIKEVAEYLKVTERTIYRLAAAKQIPAFKVGGSWRFSRPEIDAWIKQQSTAGIGPTEQGADDD